MDLALVDLSFQPTRPATDALTVRTTCTNRDLPSRLPFGNEAGDFELETGAPIKRIVALRKPTSPIRPPLGKAMQWRLISHLSLNYLSLVSEGREALQEILKLYDFAASAYSSKIVEGITGLKSKRQFSRVHFRGRHRFCPRHPGGAGTGRRAVCGRRRLPVRQRH